MTKAPDRLEALAALATDNGDSMKTKPVPWDVLLLDQAQLRDESRAVYEGMVRATFGTGSHRFHMTLYGFMMAAFASIDLHSRLWVTDPNRGTKAKLPQTARMVAYMNRFLPGTSTAHAVAVQLWRHTLMHTGGPRQIVDRDSRREFSYLLHWSSAQLPAEQHFELESDKKLNLALDLLLGNIAAALATIRREAENDRAIAAQTEMAWQEIVIQKFSLAAA